MGSWSWLEANSIDSIFGIPGLDRNSFSFWQTLLTRQIIQPLWVLVGNGVCREITCRFWFWGRSDAFRIRLPESVRKSWKQCGHSLGAQAHVKDLKHVAILKWKEKAAGKVKVFVDQDNEWLLIHVLKCETDDLDLRANGQTRDCLTHELNKKEDLWS